LAAVLVQWLNNSRRPNCPHPRPHCHHFQVSAQSEGTVFLLFKHNFLRH
jgi:hypothetical protein